MDIGTFAQSGDFHRVGANLDPVGGDSNQRRERISRSKESYV